MVKFVLRFALIWGLTMLLRPYAERMFKQLAAQAPEDSFLEEVVVEFGERCSTGLIQTFGETVGDLVFGSK